MLACTPARPLDVRAEGSRWESGRRHPATALATRDGTTLPRLTPPRGPGRPAGAAPAARAANAHPDLGATAAGALVSAPSDDRTPADRVRHGQRSRAPPLLQS